MKRRERVFRFEGIIQRESHQVRSDSTASSAVPDVAGVPRGYYTLRWWVAVNGHSCSASPSPLPTFPGVSPTPQMLLGFVTRPEQLLAQELILKAPSSDVGQLMLKLADAGAGHHEVVVGKMVEPEPPTHGPTYWLSGETIFRPPMPAT